jgi:hypothetical protein
MSRVAQDEITDFFRQVVVAINESIRGLDIRDEEAWELARRLHQLWREALRRVNSATSVSPGSHSKGHPAMEDLLQMIDVEVEQ